MNEDHRRSINDLPIRVIIVDDHPLIRQGLQALLKRETDIEVVAEAADGQEAMGLVEKLKPDIVVLDIVMPGLDGIRAMEQIKIIAAKVNILIVSTYNRPGLIRRAVAKGAKGYVLKSVLKEELVLAIRAINQGKSYFSSTLNRNFQ
jgi:DNA-binding NarL/FixJ family response regulator